MTQRSSLEAIERLIVYPFRDPEWKRKLVIGSAVTLPSILIPIIPPVFLMGYAARIMRRTIEGEEEPVLPEWDDWSGYFTDGLRLLVANFVYALPMILLFIAGYALMMTPVFMEPFGVGDDVFLATIAIAGVMVGFVLFAVAFLVAILSALVLPVVVGHVVAKESLGAAFRVGEWWRILRGGILGFVAAVLILMGVFYGLYFVIGILYMSVVFCCLIPLVACPIAFYLSSISAVVFGEAYRRGSERLELEVAASA